MWPCCDKCGTEKVEVKRYFMPSDFYPKCRCKLGKTFKSPQNRMTKNQRSQFKKGRFSFPMAFHERPLFAQIQ